MRPLPLPRARVVGLLGLAVGVSVPTMVACLTDPPPDLVLPVQQPEILGDAVRPYQGTITQVPNNFVIPIQIADPAVPCFWRFTVTESGGTPAIRCGGCPTASLKDGTETETIAPGATLLGASTCTQIEFALTSDPACTSPTGAVALWQYVGPGCFLYDAGSLQDGAFPDASSDGLPVVPEGGDL